MPYHLFSTRTRECMSVCVCVRACVCLCQCTKTLGWPREAKTYWIWLKFGTLVLWVNTWGCFFPFLKILIKTSGRSREGVNDQICMKYGTLIDFGNTWRFISYFENFDFWAQNWPKNFRSALVKARMVKFAWNLVHL